MNTNFWLFRDHWGEFTLIQKDVSVLPDLIEYFKSVGFIQQMLDDADIAQSIKHVRESWDALNTNATVSAADRFIREWHYAQCDTENVTSLTFSQYLAK